MKTNDLSHERNDLIMKKISLKNTNSKKFSTLETFDSDGVLCGEISINEEGKSDYCVDFDEGKFNSLRFVGDSKTGKLYPGSLSIGIEYKFNENMGRELTYLYSPNVTRSGRVDNYVLTDEKNLAHREDKSKKISVFVPKSYDGKTPHDILYFFDAQNLFSAAGDYTENGDPYGSWQLDFVINELHRQYGKNIIVVGIDNADMYRSQELFMDPKKFGKLSPLAFAIPEDDFTRGYLEGLSSFMVTTLHSFIKDKYLVKDDNIGIGGSSMGGIASFFCSLYEMGFYKYVLSYSPAYGLYEMEAFDNWFRLIDFKKYADILPKIHIYCGVGDMLEEQLLPAAKAMKNLLVSHGYDGKKLFETYDSDKPHNEESWRLVLPESFSYLFDLKG